MPQALIEYSKNVATIFDARRLAHLLHARMVELIDTDLESCKTRLVELADTIIGDGEAGHAMINVEIRILSGRAEAQKTALGQAVLEDARACVQTLPGDLQLTVSVGDIDRSHYHKIVLPQSPT